MTNPLKLNIPVQLPRLYTPGAAPTSAQLLEGQPAINLSDLKFFTVDQYGNVQEVGVSKGDLAAVAFSGNYSDLHGAPAATGVTSVNRRVGAIVLTAVDVGLPVDLLSGVGGTLATQYIPPSLTGAINYQGSWDASANLPNLQSGTANSSNKGEYYVVSKPGTTSIDGNSSWNAGDWILSNGQEWDRIPLQSSAVLTVNNQTGNVTISPASLGLAAVATSGSYNDLLNLPPNPAQAQIGFNAQGTPTLISEIKQPFGRPISIPANFAGSQCFSSLQTGTVGTVGIFKYPAATPTSGTQIGQLQVNSNGTFSYSANTPVTFQPGDIIGFRFLTTNINQLSVTLVGTWLS